MAAELTLTGKLYAQATPAGSFYAISSPNPDKHRQTLINILRHGENQPMGAEEVLAWTGEDNLEEGLRVILRLQRLGMLRGAETPISAVQDRLEDILPGLIGNLSDKEKAILADDNGFYLAASGYPHEAAEELAGLAADLLALHNRHQRLLKNNLSLASESWALVDPAGRAELGFWPLYVGRQSFVLVVGETPRLQNQEFVTLVQALNNRYA